MKIRVVPLDAVEPHGAARVFGAGPPSPVKGPQQPVSIRGLPVWAWLGLLAVVAVVGWALLASWVLTSQQARPSTAGLAAPVQPAPTPPRAAAVPPPAAQRVAPTPVPTVVPTTEPTPLPTAEPMREPTSGPLASLTALGRGLPLQPVYDADFVQDWARWRSTRDWRVTSAGILVSSGAAPHSKAVAPYTPRLNQSYVVEATLRCAPGRLINRQVEVMYGDNPIGRYTGLGPWCSNPANQRWRTLSIEVNGDYILLYWDGRLSYLYTPTQAGLIGRVITHHSQRQHFSAVGLLNNGAPMEVQTFRIYELDTDPDLPAKLERQFPPRRR